jgi:hypothetical protein
MPETGPVPDWDEAEWCWRLDGRRLVNCDDNCRAYAEPDMGNLAEVSAAFAHWREHGNLAGCSHSR